MSNAPKRINNLIEDLEREHGIAQALRVTRHLLAAHDELARKPLAPKQGTDQVLGGSITRYLKEMPV